MDDKEFHEILKKYRLGKASEEEKKFIDRWYDILGRQPDLHLSEHEKEELQHRHWMFIADDVNRSHKGKRVFLWSSAAIAASVIIGMICFVYLTYTGISPGVKHISNEEVSGRDWQALANETPLPKEFSMADGSKVILEPHSEIKISSRFNESTREVRLDGKAFFEVTHNPNKPFIVYATHITTKVLGTSFTISAFKEDKNLSVAVKSGKVAVSVNNENTQEKAEIILTPNHEVVYNQLDEKISLKIVDAPQPILPLDEIEQMRFSNAPVTEIFAAIEKIYGVDVEFDAAAFSSCRLTTSVSEGNLYNRLTIITSAIGAKYELNENRITIQGKGCP